MNNFTHSVKYQDGSEYNHPGYTPRHSTRSPTRRSYTNKHTNTPHDFMVCLKCQEKISRKVNQQCNNCAVGDCDRNMLEYSKALNYINSCHMIINQMMKQSKDSNDFIKMPDLPNFVDVFNSLTNMHALGGDTSKLHRKSTHESRYNTQVFEDKSRNNSSENKNKSSSKVYQLKSSGRDEQVKQTTKGKYIELLPDMKHENYKNPDSLSPGTTESEESDFDMQLKKTSRVVMPCHKFKSKIRTSPEKVIYEEDSHDDDSSKTFQKKENQVNENNKDDGKRPSTTERVKPIQNSSMIQRSKPLSSSSVPCGTFISSDNSKKIKQRSSSSVTPRERPKITYNRKGSAQEVAGNFSDTAITAGSNIGQIKKFGAKSLSTPISSRNNELSQQDLDKYAKELLGSESPTSRSPRSKSPVLSNSFSQTTTIVKAKFDQDKNKKYPKTVTPTPAMRLRVPDSKKKPCPEKQQTVNNNANNASQKASSLPSPNIRQIQEQQSNQQQQQQQQQQQKKYKKNYDNQQPVEQNTPKKQSCCRKSTCGFGNTTSVLTGIVQSQCKTTGYSFGTITSQAAEENNYLRSRHEKQKVSKLQEEDDDESKSPCRTNDIDEDNGSSPDQLNLLCDNTETLNMHCRPCSQSGNKMVSMSKAQYAVTTKPHDFFTVNRKSNSMRIRCSNQEMEYDMNMESDDIKTDSDIEEDHFDKDDDVPLSRKSSKASGPNVQMTHVLSHLGLLPNAQMAPETEQLMNEAKSTRANDERNRPFREPRKTNEDPSERIMKIEEDRMREVYPSDSLTQLHRTISEESSDIKSDEELYNVESHSKNVPFNYCLGNGRYQS